MNYNDDEVNETDGVMNKIDAINEFDDSIN